MLDRNAMLAKGQTRRMTMSIRMWFCIQVVQGWSWNEVCCWQSEMERIIGSRWQSVSEEKQLYAQV